MNTGNEKNGMEASQESSVVEGMIAHVKKRMNTPEKKEIAALKKKRKVLGNLIKQKASIDEMFAAYQERGGKLAKDKFVRLLKSFAVTKTRLKQKTRASEEGERKPTALGTDAHQGARAKYFMGDQDENK